MSFAPAGRLMAAAFATLCIVPLLSSDVLAQGRQPNRPPQQKSWAELKEAEFEGPIVGIQGQMIISQNAVGDPVAIVPAPVPETQVWVKGTADLDVLATKMFVRFTGTVNEEDKVETPVTALEWFSPYPGQTFTPLVAGQEGEIAGQVLKFKDNVLELNAFGENNSRKRISVAVDPAATLSVLINDYRVAAGQQGAHVRLSGKKVNDQQLYGVRIDIELAEPLSKNGGR